MSKLGNVGKIIKTFFVFWKEFSLKVAFARIGRDIPFLSWEKRKMTYDNAVLDYLKQFVENNINMKYGLAEKTIWVMWWQGEESMPPIVKACWRQLNSVVNNQKLVLITSENWKQYVSVPDYITAKVEGGIISLTHFSDIVRMCLLEKYGGLWLDATMWCEIIPEDALEQEIYTLHAPGMFPAFVSNGNYSTFCLGTNQSDRMYFSLVKNCFLAYWKKQNLLIDYLLIDYFMELCFDKSIKAKELINLNPLNDKYYSLNIKINEQYNSDKFRKIVSESPMQKLTYKKELMVRNKKGELTNYGHLLKRSGVGYEI